MDLKLKRLSAGHYVIPGTDYHVFRHEGRLSGRPFVEYQLLCGSADGFEKDMWGHHRVLVKAGTLASLQPRLERYFTPRVLPAR